MLNLHKCEGYRSVNLFFVLPSSAFWLPGQAIVHTVFSKTARPHPAMAWLFDKWRAGSSMLHFSEGLKELLTQNALMQKAKSEKQMLQNGQEVFVEQGFLCTMGLSEPI